MRRILTWLGALLLAVAISWSAITPATADEQWVEVSETVTSLLAEVPALHQAGDDRAVEAALRKAYYEEYQVSGLEDEIKHRLGADRSSAFQTGIVELRNKSRDGASQEEIEQLTSALIAQLATDVEEVQTAPEVNDRWARVASDISDVANGALALYEHGDSENGLKEATRAYLQHYEADGLEKATLSYLPSGRAAEVEKVFRDVRVGIRDGAPLDEVRANVEQLSQMVTEDAAALDALGASESVGWSGFVAAFLILLREGVEALLVVAAVITYVIKTGRRDQLRGVYLGIGAAVLVSVALAVVFNTVTSSGALGLAQELIEGVVGFLAVAMLIYISSWILSKSEGDAWHRYINATIDKKSESGGRWALFIVVFLAVAREGFETILFFVPVFGAAQDLQRSPPDLGGCRHSHRAARRAVRRGALLRRQTAVATLLPLDVGAAVAAGHHHGGRCGEGTAGRHDLGSHSHRRHATSGMAGPVPDGGDPDHAGHRRGHRAGAHRLANTQIFRREGGSPSQQEHRRKG